MKVQAAKTRTERAATSSGREPPSWRLVAYWLATVAVVGELGLGGIWDIARLPAVAGLVTHLGYPSYFLVLLGTWKVLGALALLIPGRTVLKEWAYAGAFFTYTGAMVSHLTTGYSLGELGLLIPLTVLTVLSWALRPPARRIARGDPRKDRRSLRLRAGSWPSGGATCAHTPRATAWPGHTARWRS